MFWIFLMITSAAGTFVALGMYAVWLRVLTIALMVSVFIVLGLTGGMLWKRLFP